MEYTVLSMTDPIPDCFESIRGSQGQGSGVRCMYNAPRSGGPTIIRGYRDFLESSVVQSVIPWRRNLRADQEELYGGFL